MTHLQIVEQLLAALSNHNRAAYCRLVETRGSTPQKAGACMAVFQDGGQIGTLGGGCVEAEVKRRALALLEKGSPEILTFQLDHDYGWDDGLICGGRMQIYVRPLIAIADSRHLNALKHLLTAATGCVEAISFDFEKSGVPSASSFLFDAEGEFVSADTLAPPTAETINMVKSGLPNLTTRPRPQAKNGIAYLPELSRSRLLIVGGGHVGQAVSKLASELDFDVWILDDREEFANPDRIPSAQRHFCGPIGPMLQKIEVDHNSFCLIVTRGHNHDEEALRHLIDRGAHYLGMIGSRRKIRLIFDDLEELGVSTESLAKVFAPVGIDIGSQTVAEIAVSIVAELVAYRNLGVVPGRPASVVSDSI